MEPFSKQPLTLSCIYEVNKEIESKISNFAKREEIGPNKLLDPASPQLLLKYKINPYESHETLIAEFLNKKIYCSLKVACVHPLIKIEPTSLFFGDIAIKSTSMKKLTIRNVREGLPVKVSFLKSFSFEVIPTQATIFPNQDHIFEVFLTPVSIGNFNSFLSCMVSNSCKIDISVAYKSISQIKKSSSSLYLSCVKEQEDNLNLMDISNLNKTMTKLRQMKTRHSVSRSLLSKNCSRKLNALQSTSNQI